MSRLSNIWNSEKEKTWLKWLARLLWVLAFLGVICSLLTILIVGRSDLPGFEELENPQYDLASVIYDVNGEPFGKYYIENREFIDYRNLSPNLHNALISVEDARYYNHSGIDFKALLRVAFKSILLRQQSSGGGSTISQQLAKLLFKRESLSGKSKLNRAFALAAIKFKEWITAVRLERRYTKEEIIAMYLNKFEFINGAHGIHSASEIYFGKDQTNLEIEEAAVLVGMLKNPALYNPIRFSKKSQGRRNVVLQMMYRNDKIDREQRDSLMAKPLDMGQFNRSTQSDGLAPYFRAELTKWLKPLLQQREYHKPEGGVYDIYRDGLKVFTTIDARYQQHAEDAMLQHMKSIQARYWRAWDRKDPFTFEAEEGQEELRKEGLARRIRDTEIYRDMYDATFADLSARSKEDFDIVLKEPTIRRLHKNIAYVEEIDRDVRSKFKKLVRSPLWKEISTTWITFEQNVKNKFDQEVEAEVFSYSDEGTEIKQMSLRDSVLYHLRHLQAGLLALDPKTGDIKAWVGGPSHTYFKYDHVTLRRQVGSTIKPFVYATAIGVQGLSPCQEYEDIQYTIAPGDANFNVDAEWSPSNANGLFTMNKYNLYQGLLYSKNSITVRIVKELGTMAPIRDLLHNSGIDKYERFDGGEGRLIVPNVPSLCLGSVDLSLLEMTGAYTTFANDGVYTKPRFVSRIEDKNGKVIYQSGLQQKRALNKLYNSVMVDMLQNNVGGGFGLGIKTPVGGKTGTTNDYADGWFMAISPNLVTGIWVGGDEKWVRFYTLENGQGFIMARPLYIDFMKRLEADVTLGFDTDVTFAPAPQGFKELADCSRYKQIAPEDERSETQDLKEELDDFDDIEFDDLEEDLPESDTLGGN